MRVSRCSLSMGRAANGAERGFTLLELMVTIAVVAVLAAIAVPSFQHAVDSTKISDTANTLVGDLNYARVESISRGTRVAVTSSSGDWNNGWSVVASAATSGGSVTTLRQRDAVGPTVQIQALPAGDNPQTVQFVPQGHLSALTKACFQVKRDAGGSPSHIKPAYINVHQSGAINQYQVPDSGTPTCEG